MFANTISDNDSKALRRIDFRTAIRNLTMAIEFDCPYCTATIRVPDAYGGKQGRCPKCDTRLLVPLVVRPGSTTVPDASSSPVTTSGPAPGIDSTSPTDVFAIKPAPAPARHRRSARRRPSRALVIGMPVLCFLVLLAVIFFSVTGSLPELTGDLVATRLEETTLPVTVIPWADARLSPEDQQTLRAFLETTPETLASEVMTCRMVGTDAGIEVRLTAGAESSWFVVDTTDHKPLALWLKKERTALNTSRISVLNSSLAAYCKDKLAQIAGEPVVIDAMSVRDNVAINACGGALSYVVQGVAGNRLVPCAYEDDRGMLYFCLPRETQGFQIPGRTFADGKKLFGGEFTAVVRRAQAPAESGSKPGSFTGDENKNDGETKTSEDSMMPDAESQPMDEPKSESMSGEPADESEMSAPDMSEDKESDGEMMNKPGSDTDPGMKPSRSKGSGKGMFKEEDEDEPMDGKMMDGEMMDSGKMDSKTKPKSP